MDSFYKRKTLVNEAEVILNVAIKVAASVQAQVGHLEPPMVQMLMDLIVATLTGVIDYAPATRVQFLLEMASRFHVLSSTVWPEVSSIDNEYSPIIYMNLLNASVEIRDELYGKGDV